VLGGFARLRRLLTIVLPSWCRCYAKSRREIRGGGGVGGGGGFEGRSTVSLSSSCKFGVHAVEDLADAAVDRAAGHPPYSLSVFLFDCCPAGWAFLDAPVATAWDVTAAVIGCCDIVRRCIGNAAVDRLRFSAIRHACRIIAALFVVVTGWVLHGIAFSVGQEIVAIGARQALTPWLWEGIGAMLGSALCAGRGFIANGVGSRAAIWVGVRACLLVAANCGVCGDFPAQKAASRIPAHRSELLAGHRFSR